MAEHLMTADEVAAYIHPTVAPSTVHDARRSGALAAVKIGRRHFHTREQVDTWIAGQTTTAALLTTRSRHSDVRRSA